jgi:hypothetical protein
VKVPAAPAMPPPFGLRQRGKALTPTLSTTTDILISSLGAAIGSFGSTLSTAIQGSSGCVVTGTSLSPHSAAISGHNAKDLATEARIPEPQKQANTSLRQLRWPPRRGRTRDNTQRSPPPWTIALVQDVEDTFPETLGNICSSKRRMWISSM